MTPLTIPYHTGQIIVLADLHFDYYARQNRDPFSVHDLHISLNWDVDALIIAGDLVDALARNWSRSVGFLKRYVPEQKIYIMPGNHDYYGHRLDADQDFQACIEASGAHFVQKRMLLHGATRILACTLWTDFELLGTARRSMALARRRMRDYSAIGKTDTSQKLLQLDEVIRPQELEISPQDTLEIHRDHRTWLETMLAQPHFACQQGQTVVITHHGPHPIAAEPIGELSPAFHSNLEALILRHQPDIWFFGHSHQRFHGTIGRTDLRNVGIGYPDERQPNRALALEDICTFTSAPFTRDTHD